MEFVSAQLDKLITAQLDKLRKFVCTQLDKLEQKIPGWVTPNLLSWSRMAAIPCMWGLYLWDPWVAFVLYTFACLTDALDGHLARKRGLCSAYGKRLDERSDKGFVFGTLVLLLADGLIPLALESWIFWVAIGIILREVLITGLRARWPERAKRVPSLRLAKVKTFMLMVGLGLLMLADVSFSLYETGLLCLVLAFVFGVVSGCHYAFLFAKRG